MKITLLYFVLLFSLITTQLLEANHDYYPSTPDQVFDISGGKILLGSTYYVLPIIPSTSVANALALTNTTKTEQQPPCPLDVVAVDDTNHGLPIIFHGMTRREFVVNISRDVNIEFYAESTRCPQSSTVWKVGDLDSTRGTWFVTTGGSLGKPGKKTVRNWFKVEKYDDDYKIVYCPAICSIINCKPKCSDVGIYVDENQNKRLALTDVPLKVQFKQA